MSMTPSTWFKTLLSRPGLLDKFASSARSFDESMISQSNTHGFARITWYRNGVIHRDSRERNIDLPAVEWDNGTRLWIQNGKLHRDCQDLPAFDDVLFGCQVWYRRGVMFRDSIYDVEQPVCVGSACLQREYYIDSVLSRLPIDGVEQPAIITTSGYLKFYHDGRRYHPETDRCDYDSE